MTLLFLNNLGGGELLVIFLFALLFFGSKRIPDLARGLGRGMREVKDAMNGIKHDIQDSVNLDEEKKIIEDAKKEIKKPLDDGNI
jgi:sec-independent protein translocase protein TatA